MEIAYYILTFGAAPLVIASIWLSIFRPGQRKTFIISAVAAGMYLLAGLFYLALPDANPLGASFATVLVPGIWATLAASDYRDYKRKTVA